MQSFAVEPQTVVYEVACDRCEVAVQRGEPGFDAMSSIRLEAEYGSIFGDGNVVEIDLCETCLKSTLGEWLRIRPRRWQLARDLDAFQPKRHGGEFPQPRDDAVVDINGDRQLGELRKPPFE